MEGVRLATCTFARSVPCTLRGAPRCIAWDGCSRPAWQSLGDHAVLGRGLVWGMRQLSPLDAQFLMIESPTTVGHVGSLIVLDPSTTPGEGWNLDTVREVIEARLHLSPIFRQRLVQVPLGLTRPYWVDDPHFDIEFHLRELQYSAPGSDQQLGEQVARIHARPLDRLRPLWELYVISGLADGRAARRVEGAGPADPGGRPG